MKAKILLVEDERVVAKDLQRKLESLGYTVMAPASTGEAAIGEAARDRPDVVVMDIRLEGKMDGVEAAGRIRSLYDIPIVYLTAYADDATLQRAKESEPFGYVGKPFELRELSTTIELALYKHSLERKVKESEARYRLLYEESPAINLVVGPDGVIQDANGAATESVGYSRDELIGKQMISLVASEHAEKAATVLQRGIRGDVTPGVDVNAVAKDGSVHTILFTRGTAAFRGEGGVTSILLTGIDITERKRVEEALADSKRKIEDLHEKARQLEACGTEEEVYRLTVEAADRMLGQVISSFVVADADNLEMKAASPGFPQGAATVAEFVEGLARMTHRTRRTHIFGDLLETLDVGQIPEEFNSGISAPVAGLGVFQVFSAQRGAFNRDDARLVELLLGHAAQALERVRLQTELTYQAIHDPLTGVYNRYYLDKALERECKRSQRSGHFLAFLMVDVDRFKEINDRFGHQTGDKVLKAVASLLLEEVRGSDFVVRYGGDEFLVVLPETGREASTVRTRILKRAASRNEMTEMLDFPITLSIGSAYWRPDRKQPVDKILSEADRRMYKDKRRHQNST
jgi:diguanylate cyclase (GGDEF)-like protein/PAS domain S-box-containing protein